MDNYENKATKFGNHFNCLIKVFDAQRRLFSWQLS